MTLEGRRTISRLTQLYKSVHNIIAFNIDEHYTNHRNGNITTIKISSISFAHPTARKNSYRYSFIQVLWLGATVYLLLLEKPHLLTPISLDCAVLSFILILPEPKLLRHVRWPSHTYSYNRLSRMWRSDCSTQQKQIHGLKKYSNAKHVPEKLIKSLKK